MSGVLKSLILLACRLERPVETPAVAAGDDGLEDMGGRMTRMHPAAGECSGTAARIQRDRLTVSCDKCLLMAVGKCHRLGRRA